MKHIKFIFGALALICSACIAPENPAAGETTAPITASIQEFKILEGDDWEGGLSYLNYNSDERSTIPVKLAIKILSETKLQYAIQYPGEEEHNAKEVLRLSKDGTKLDGATITKRDVTPEGALVLKTRAKGKDNNKPAELQMVYIVSPNIFRIQKHVKFEGEEAFFNRNEYSFTR